jgi:hypothetical protein
VTNEEILRLNYYERQFLTSRDFQDEQAYHIEMRRRHNLAHHTFGTVAGLDIIKDETSGYWVLKPGFAVDGYGREIIVFEQEPLDTERIADKLATETLPAKLDIWISYDTEASNPPKPGFEVCGEPDQYTRIEETFKILYDNEPDGFDLEPSDAAQPYSELTDDVSKAPWPIWLGTVTWDTDANGKKAITAVDAADRRYVGLRAAELSAATVAQNVPTPATLFKDSLTIRADETKATGMATGEQTRLIVDGNLEVDGQIDFRTTAGADNSASLLAYRDDKDLCLQIGTAGSDGARLVVGAVEEEKFVVEADGAIQADGNLQIKNSNALLADGGKFVLRNADKTETPDITEITRKDNDAGHKDLRLGLGSSDMFGARLVVGPADTEDANFWVKNDGETSIKGPLTVEGLINAVTLNVTGSVTAGSLDVTGNAEIEGDLTVDGLVNGRDIAADGAAVDTIAAKAKEIVIYTNRIDSGTAIPLPSGWSASDCKVVAAPEIPSTSAFLEFPDTGNNVADALLEAVTDLTIDSLVIRYYTDFKQDGSDSFKYHVTHNVRIYLPYVGTFDFSFGGRYRYMLIGVRSAA